MRLFASLYRAALLTLVTAGVVSGQTLKGRLFDEGSDEPIQGAFVILLDDTGMELRRILTDSRGGFVVQAPGPGRYVLRAERIGFRSTTSHVLELGSGEILEYDMLVPLEPIELGGIKVEAERQCVARPQQAIRTAQVWEEARKALEGVRWSERQREVSYEIFHYRRELDPQTFVTLSEQSESFWREASQPFVTPPADTLVEKGFVRRTEEGPAFYAPDAEVLLSDVFLDSHCFGVRLGEGKDAGRVGLAFEPTPGRELPDVRGVLWLDRTTAELSYIEYRYTGLDLPVLTDQFGGLLEFERRPTGAWITKRWWIRGPLVGAQWAWWRGAERQDFLAAIMEEGGEVIRIRDPTDRPAAGIVVGTVFDSIQMQPLAGAKVYLSGTVYFDTTDATGAFKIEEVASGDYSIAFSHPRIHSLKYYNVVRPVSVEPDEETGIDLAIPTMKRVIDTRLTRFRHGLARFSEPDSLRMLKEQLDAAESNSRDTLLMRGLISFRVYELTGQRSEFERALRIFRRTAKLYPDVAWAHFGLGLALAEGPEVRIPQSSGYRQRSVHVGSLAEVEAQAALVRAVELDPSFSDAALELASLELASRGRRTLDAAANALRQVIEAGEPDPAVWLALSDVEAALGNLSAAAEAAESALRLGADTASALHALSLALLHDGIELGADTYFAGVDRLSSAGAERYFEDLLGLVKEKEEAQWRVADLGAQRDWLWTFWNLRAAFAGVTVPERLAEHYRRLGLAHQRYRRLGTRGAPPGGAVSRAMLIGSRHRRVPFDDRGLIFIRHGEPERIIRTAAQKIPPNETWVYQRLYQRLGEGPQLFHFFKLEGRPDFVLAGELPRCDPLYYKYGDSGRLGELMHRSDAYGRFTHNDLQPLVDYYEDRAWYDPRYQLFAFHCIEASVGADWRRSLQAEDSVSGAADHMGGLDTVAVNLEGLQLSAEMRRAAAVALERETYQLVFDSELPFMYQVYTFRGRNGLTDVTAALMIPGADLQARIQDDLAIYSLNLSFILIDTLRSQVARTDTLYHYRAPLPLVPGEYLRTHVDVSARPSDSALYRVVLRNENVAGKGQLYGGPTAIRDYSGPRLMLSDVVLGEAEGGYFSRGKHGLALRPGHRFQTEQPFTLYYEIYNLPPDTPYRTVITIALTKASRGDPPAYSLSFDGLAGAVDEIGVQEMRRLSTALLPGRYGLQVAVTNLQSGESARRDSEFIIRE